MPNDQVIEFSQEQCKILHHVHLPAMKEVISIPTFQGFQQTLTWLVDDMNIERIQIRFFNS